MCHRFVHLGRTSETRKGRAKLVVRLPLPRHSAEFRLSKGQSPRCPASFVHCFFFILWDIKVLEPCSDSKKKKKKQLATSVCSAKMHPLLCILKPNKLKANIFTRGNLPTTTTAFLSLVPGSSRDHTWRGSAGEKYLSFSLTLIYWNTQNLVLQLLSEILGWFHARKEDICNGFEKWDLILKDELKFQELFYALAHVANVFQSSIPGCDGCHLRNLQHFTPPPSILLKICTVRNDPCEVLSFSQVLCSFWISLMVVLWRHWVVAVAEDVPLRTHKPQLCRQKPNTETVKGQVMF